jgi:hypothetical protein
MPLLTVRLVGGVDVDVLNLPPLIYFIADEILNVVIQNNANDNSWEVRPSTICIAMN